MHTYMITDYPHNNSAERKGGRGDTDRAVSVARACKWWDFKSPVIWSRRIKHFCAPSLSQRKNSEIWGGWGHLSSIPLMLPLQIPCTLVDAELISNSCAPLPDQIQRNLKESPRLLPRWAYVIWLGWMKKIQNTGEPMPNFFLVGVDFIVFLAFFSNFKPPIPLTRALLFIWPLNIGLTQTCIATAVPPPSPLTWEP